MVEAYMLTAVISDSENLEDTFKLVVVTTTDDFKMYDVVPVDDFTEYNKYSSAELEEDGWSYL
jgi:hypothetical protein